MQIFFGSLRIAGVFLQKLHARLKNILQDKSSAAAVVYSAFFSYVLCIFGDGDNGLQGQLSSLSASG